MEQLESEREIGERASADAAEVLRVFGPAPGALLDPVAVAAELGVVVSYAELEHDVDAKLAATGAGAELLLALAQPLPLQRYVVAHALGHYADRRHGVGVGVGVAPAPGSVPEPRKRWLFVDRRSGGLFDDPAEVYADAFALALLMPEEQIGYSRVRCDSDIAAAAHFAVSLAALRRRRASLTRIWPAAATAS